MRFSHLFVMQCLIIVKVGGLFGIMEAVESLAGFIGPALGGVLFNMGKNTPLMSVVLLYIVVFIVVHLYFRKYIVYFKKAKSEDENSLSEDDDVDTACAAEASPALGDKQKLS